MLLKEAREATEFLQNQTGSFVPDTGVVLGTGLGRLLDDIDIYHSISYEDIPHFPVSTVESHSGKLIFGVLNGHKLVVMQGRFHYYEGYTMQQVTFPVRVMKLLGIRRLFISNAAGGLSPDYNISDIMIINDHINLQPENPLTGPNEDEFGVRFPDMSDPYDRTMIDKGLEIAAKYSIRAHEGVYVAVPGPNLETRAEYKYLRTIGADAVGMSTVPENIVARHMGLPVFALSVITDLCTPEKIRKVTVEEVIKAAMGAEPGMKKIMEELISLQTD
ncbi:purine-nucleoside phosphorylase [Roseivirga sp. BDSF3-8]|uniref:purine-nucleoside phosphorylase n=1 Tax=Roseivirga sp. BDSF3-8 TaxID=3241598 RepID=UPI0035326494